jgi:spore maturation protein CgeB
MRFRLFYHSLVSDWNHGNAHFLRGVVAELQARGHAVRVFEPRDGWSRTHLERDHGADAVADWRAAFPTLRSELYDDDALVLDDALADADAVIVHEWTSPRLIARLAEHRTREGNYCLLFHDTHHRAVSNPDALRALPLDRFDGVLAFGLSLADQYYRLGWGRRVWVWHEAADTRIFFPRSSRDTEGDLVWIGNWGDDERARELQEFLLEPVQRLGLKARVHGVRYPPDALAQLRASGVTYAGWLPNHRVPDVFAAFRATVHVPRQPYVAMLPGIPTIRPFEALACGIPLVSAPWRDVEELFRPGDMVSVRNGDEMASALRRVLSDDAFAAATAASGLETIRSRHTCAHRVDELLAIVTTLRAPAEVLAAHQERS